VADRPTLSSAQVVRQLQDLGVEEGGVLLVHTSYRAVRPVEGGPAGLIQALRDALGPEGTLVMPSWPASAREVFAPAGSAADPDLGVVADTFWRQPGVERSVHPHAFAAVGPEAGHVLSDPLPLPPHRRESPVGRVHGLDGHVLLLGVDHDADTTIHLAELIGEVPYRLPKSCVALQDGRPVRIRYGENDHCCARFRLVGEWLAAEGLEARGPVGYASARLARSRSVVDVVVSRLADDPLLFLHGPQEGCVECDEARRSVDAGSLQPSD
jgi:aminoglycoside N3'-acetyltransferase